MKTILQVGVNSLMILALVFPADAQEWGVRHLESLEYPLIAILAREEARVLVVCRLRKDGSVADADVVASPTLSRKGSVLVRAARKNALKWRFGYIGANVTSAEPRVQLVYSFRLVGSCTTASCPSQFSFDHPDQVLVTTQQRSADH